MSVIIRLARYGRRNLTFYRIVAADKTKPRDGRCLEYLGYFNPSDKNRVVKIDAERVKYWLSVGAKPSPTMEQMIAKEIPGFFEEIETKRLNKIKEARKARKKRAKKSAKPKKRESKALRQKTRREAKAKKLAAAKAAAEAKKAEPTTE